MSGFRLPPIVRYSRANVTVVLVQENRKVLTGRGEVHARPTRKGHSIACEPKLKTRRAVYVAGIRLDNFAGRRRMAASEGFGERNRRERQSAALLSRVGRPLPKAFVFPYAVTLRVPWQSDVTRSVPKCFLSKTTMPVCLIGLGSNQGNRQATLDAAVARLAAHPQSRSSPAARGTKRRRSADRRARRIFSTAPSAGNLARAARVAGVFAANRRPTGPAAQRTVGAAAHRSRPAAVRRSGARHAFAGLAASATGRAAGSCSSRRPKWPARCSTRRSAGPSPDCWRTSTRRRPTWPSPARSPPARRIWPSGWRRRFPAG